MLSESFLQLCERPEPAMLIKETATKKNSSYTLKRHYTQPSTNPVCKPKNYATHSVFQTPKKYQIHLYYRLYDSNIIFMYKIMTMRCALCKKKISFFWFVFRFEFIVIIRSSAGQFVFIYLSFL